MKQLLFVSLFFTLAACFNPVEYNIGEGYDLDDVLKFEILSNSHEIPADGFSKITLRAVIPQNTDSDKRTVTFATTSGKFVGGSNTHSVLADSKGSALVMLQSTQFIDTAIVTVNIANFKREEQIVFTQALPSSIRLDANTFELKASLSISTTITAILERLIGVPTIGTEVQFTTKPDTVGLFRKDTLSNKDGIASVIFSAGNTNFRGLLTIQARVNGTPVTGETQINIVSPD